MCRAWMAFLIIMSAVSVAQTQDKGSVVRLDPALGEIVASDAKIEKVAGDLAHTEGPTWMRKGGYLIFSEIDNNVVDKWDPRDGKVSVFLEAPDVGYPVRSGSSLGGSNGITLDRQGRVVIGTRSSHQVVRLEENGQRTVLASKYEGKSLNGVNDLVYKSDGSLYFTDPTWGVQERRRKGLPEPKWELGFAGVYLLKNGNLQLLNKEMSIPNGIAFTPDEKYLYINDTDKKTILKFEVQPDDTIAKGHVFIDMSSEKGIGNPDGMKVDEKGNVYCTGPGGVWILSPTGQHLGTFLVPEQTSNFGFGEADGKTIFFATHTALYRIRVKIAGIRP